MSMIRALDAVMAVEVHWPTIVVSRELLSGCRKVLVAAQAVVEAQAAADGTPSDAVIDSIYELKVALRGETPTEPTP